MLLLSTGAPGAQQGDLATELTSMTGGRSSRDATTEHDEVGP